MQPNNFYSIESAIDRQPLTVSPQTSLIAVISLMQKWGNSCSVIDTKGTSETDTTIGTDNSCVLIVENSQLVGIFTERDLVKLIATGSNTENVTVGEVGSQNVVTLTATGSEDIFDALNMLRQHRIRHLPIVDDRQNLLGLIAAKNLRQKLQPINLMQWRKVSEVMTTEVIHAAPDDSVRHIARLMAEREISCVAIAESKLDPETNSPLVRPVGIITERDLVQFQNLNLDLEQPARNLMSTPLFLVSPDDTLWSVHQQMQQRRVRRLLVAGARGELQGIITQTSLLQVFDPTEMYGVIEILERQVCQLELEKARLLKNRQAELENKVRERTAALEATNQRLQLEKNRRQQSERRLDSILDSLEDLVYSIEPDTFDLLYMNSAAVKIYGRQVAEFYDNSNLWLEVVHPEDRDRVFDWAQNIIETEASEIEYRIIRPDGEICWLRDRIHLIRDPEGTPIRIDGIATNITQRKQAEIALRESQERHTLAVESSSIGIWDWDIVTEEAYFSSRWLEMLGYSRGELPDNFSTWEMLIHPEDKPWVMDILNAHLKNNSYPYEFDYRMRTKSGEWKWIGNYGKVVARDDRGKPLRMTGIHKDLSDRKRREEILQDIASGVTARAGVDFFSSLVEYLSKILKVDYAFVGELIQPEADNIKTLAVYGKGKTIDNFEYNLAGTPCKNVVGQQLCIYPEAIQQLFPQDLLLQEMAAVSYAGMPIFDLTGKALGLISIVDTKPFDNISLIGEVLKIFANRATNELERQQAEANLQKSNRLLQAISWIQTQYLADVEPAIIFDGMLDRLLELTESEYGFIGEIFFAADGSPIMEESYMKFRGRPYLKTHAITNIAWNEETKTFYAENADKGMEFHNLQTLFGAVMVTGQPVIANSPSTDPRRGGLPDGHPPLNAFLGVPFYKNDQMTGMVGIANREGGYDEAMVDYLQPFLATCSRIIEAYHGERQRQQAEAKIREQAALLDVATDAIIIRGLDNQILFWNRGAEELYGWTKAEALNRDANKLLYRKTFTEFSKIRQTVTEQGEWQGELNQVTKAGKDLVVQSRWTLVRDEARNPSSYLVVNTDITEKKQLEAQFLRTQRLESLGTLAGGIAHDLNNILSPILGFSRLLPLKLPDLDEQTQGFFRIIETNAQRGSALVRQILTFARGLEGERGIVQIRHLIAEIKQIITQTFPKTIELEINLPKNLWMVNGDVNQLHQVLMNLVVNARDAMPEGGTLTIKAENFTVDADYARLHLDATEDSYVLITVADTGVGIPPEIIDRIFEPFFTTKEIGRGTGLGLSTVIGIVKSHGGFVDVASDTKPDSSGTQVKVFLPATDVTITTTEETEEIPQGNGELILVVDDETSILEVTKVTLETYNYRVLTARNGIDAIALYAQNLKAVDVVLTDIMMPSMDGKTLIRTIKKINPEVRIIAISGLISSREIIDQIDDNIKAFMTKPYTNDDLLKAIKKTLDS